MKLKFLCVAALSAILVFSNAQESKAMKLYNQSYIKYSASKEYKVKVGWKKVGNSWYYIDKNGKYKTGWLKDNNKWYYLSKQDYKMLSNRVETIDGGNYYFNSD